MMNLYILKIRHGLRTWTESDWLLAALLILAVAFVNISIFQWARLQTAVTSQMPVLTWLLCLSTLTSYSYSWLKQHGSRRSINPDNNFWLNSSNAIGLAVILIGLPAISYYGGLMSEFGEPVAITTLGVGLLAISFSALGNVLAYYKGIWGGIWMFITLWMLIQFHNVIGVIERGLINNSDTAFLVLLLAISTTGLLFVMTQLIKNRLSWHRYSRYWQILSTRRSYPSYTGSGALIIGGCLALARDKFFFLLILLAGTVQISLTNHLVIDNSGWLFWLAIVSPITLVALMSLNLTEKYQRKLIQKRHLPLEIGTIVLSTFLSGLVIITALNLVSSLGLLRLPPPVSVSLFFSTLGAYSFAALITDSDTDSSRRGVFDQIWLIIFRGIIFILVFSVLHWMFGWNQFMTSLGLLVLALLSFGYRNPVRTATI